MEEDNLYNILIEAGADFVLPWYWYDENGNPVDLTDSTIEAQLRHFAEDPDFYEFVCTHNGLGGRISITLPNEITASIAWTSGVYDVYVTPAGGDRTRVLHGNANIVPNVTKPVDGTFLYMLGIASWNDLPAVGNTNRLYFVYDERKIYRWNGVNYIVTSVGNGILKIELKSHVDSFTDIYTIFYDDGTTFDYTVTTRGVSSVTKVGSTGTVITGVVDQYRMTFNDSSYVDYYVTNGRTFNVLGTHDSTQTYSYMDMVRSSGATYIAKQNVPANTDISNTTYWQLILAPFTLGTVTSVGYDANPEITVSGTPDAPVLNFKVPRGVPGNESIDDHAGENDTDYAWSADKCTNDISIIQNQIHRVPQTIDVNVVEGGINRSTGANNTSTIRARTAYYRIYSGRHYFIKLDSSEYYMFCAFAYSDASSSDATRRLKLTGKKQFAFVPASNEKYLRICFCHMDNTLEVTEADRATIKAALKYYTTYDTSLSIASAIPDSQTVGDTFKAVNAENLMINTLYPGTDISTRPAVVNTNGRISIQTGSGTLKRAEHGLRYTFSGAADKYFRLRFGLYSVEERRLNEILDNTKYYTLSLDFTAKFSVACHLNIYYVHYNGVESVYSVGKKLCECPDANTEVSGHGSYTFSYLQYEQPYYLIIAPSLSYTYSANDFIEIRNITLVEGKIEGAWKPSRYDYADFRTDPNTIITRTNVINMTEKLEQLTAKTRISGSTYGTKPLCLLHFSDIHKDEGCLQNIVDFADYYKNYIDDIIHTGDTVDNMYTEGLTFWNNVEGSEKILNCIGNHDTRNSSGWRQYSMSDLYDTYFAPYIENWGCTYTSGVTYYYKDYTTEKVRLIVLDDMNLSGTQLTWLTNTLSSARTAELHVIIAHHVRTHWNYDFYDTPWDDKPCIPTLGTWTDKSGSSDYPWNLPDSYASAVDDFINAGGIFICWIHGHTHYKLFTQLHTHPNQLSIAVANAGFRYAENSVWQRVAGSKSEDDFNLIAVDTYRKILRLAKVGVDYDRLMRHVDTISYNYETHQLLYTNR